MQPTLLFICLLLIYSCNDDYSKKREQYFKEYSARHKAELVENATFLAYKHTLKKSEVEKLITEYLKEYDNFSYQLILNGEIDKNTVAEISSKKKPKHVFIDDYFSTNQVMSKEEISEVLFDYEQMLNKEELESLRSTVEDMENRLENVEQ